MLYSLYDAKTQALEPVRIWAEFMRSTFENPYNPVSYTPWGRSCAAGADILEGLLRERKKPIWGLVPIASDEGIQEVTIQTVLERPFGDLLKMSIHQEGVTKQKILLVAPMSGHHATLLRGTIQTLVPFYDVYITDWRDAALVPVSEGPFSLDDYIAELMLFMKTLGRDHHVMAVCQPAPMVLAAVSLLAAADDPAQPRSMILMGGPIDVTAAPTVVTEMADAHSLDWFRTHLCHHVPLRFPGATRRVYPGFLQLRAFISMNPTRHMEAHWSFFQHLVEGDDDSAEAHRAFYDEYLAVMDVDAHFYMDTIQKVFKEHHLKKGIMTWRDVLVDPSKIEKTALFTIEGELDDISAPGQTFAAQAMCSGLEDDQKKHLLQEKVGHYGIFNGSKFRKHIAPKIRDFIELHSKDRAVEAPAIKVETSEAPALLASADSIPDVAPAKEDTVEVTEPVVAKEIPLATEALAEPEMSASAKDMDNQDEVSAAPAKAKRAKSVKSRARAPRRAAPRRAK